MSRAGHGLVAALVLTLVGDVVVWFAFFAAGSCAECSKLPIGVRLLLATNAHRGIPVVTPGSLEGRPSIERWRRG